MKRGFTLIELLVVIAIIAILAAILFPVFAKAREKARQSSCLSNVKQMALAIMQYAQDYDEIYPGAYTINPTVTWPQLLQPYIKSSQIVKCPSDPDPWAGITGWAISYIPNYNMHRPMDYAGVVGISMSAVVRPAEIITLAENADGSTGNLMPGCQYAWGCDGYVASAGYNNWARLSMARHNDGANYAFADGHAKWMKPGEAQNMPVHWRLP
ncbi:MAG: prepilin-type N-terminal cleavage/methylation domain-containing protein [Bacteroidota bacterium]